MAKKPPNNPPSAKIPADQLEAALARLEAVRDARRQFKEDVKSGRVLMVRGVDDNVAAVAVGVPRSEGFGQYETASPDASSEKMALGKPAPEPPRRRDHTEVLPP